MSTKIEPLYSKSSPFISKIIDRYALTKSGSSKETYHISICIEGSGITYNVGDSVAIFPQNSPAIVGRYLNALECSGDEVVVHAKTEQTFSLKQFLTTKANLSRIMPAFLTAWIGALKDDAYKLEIETIMADPESKKTFMKSHEPLELLELKKHGPIDLNDLINGFGPLLARFYSIASSQKTHPNEIHLTITTAPYDYKGEKRHGVATHYLCHLADKEEREIALFMQPNHGFTVPSDPETSMLMIGPGTGIAPFRAFLLDRLAAGATGKNWLFFGERNSTTDFYYEDELKAWENEGFLKLSTAFSRDQEEKIYVQDLLKKHQTAVWEWIESGANIYICGDAKQMAKDVDTTLQEIAVEEGKMEPDEAKQFFKSLRKEKRYLLDVY